VLVSLFEGVRETLDQCLDSILTMSTYHNYEIIIMTLGEVNDDLLANRKPPNTKVISYDMSFGFSKAINSTVKVIEGKYIVLLSDGVEIVRPDWIEELQHCFTSRDIGVAGGLFVSSENFISQDNDELEILAVTRSCLMIETSLFIKCKGLNEYFFNSYAEIDLCLRVREMGKAIHFSPSALIVKTVTLEKEASFDVMDRALFLDSWEQRFKIQPYLQDNLFIGA
jgi:GT2 family glycosyltransferase